MEPGTIVANRFELLAVAGSGGMGVVYRALDRETGVTVALKTLREGGPELGERFASEVETLSRIDHPHIVGYLTHGVDEKGRPFVVMPWLEGTDLQARLHEAPLSIEETFVLARHVADALGYLHERGLVHRDLKPGNLFLPGGDIAAVKVMDLGVSRATAPVRSVTSSGVLVGTPSFIAPEQARGDREIAPSVDIFALGCVLFECLTAKRLFQGQHVMAVLAKILVEEAPRVRSVRPDVPEGLDELIHRMVAKDPRERPADGRQLEEWLGNLAQMPAVQRRHPESLTTDEQRVVSVLVAVLPSDAEPPSSSADGTWSEGAPMQIVARTFGVRVHALGARTWIILAADGLSAPDQAAALTRVAMRAVDAVPALRVALTTGRALTVSSVPVGDAIDRAIALVADVLPGAPHLDDLTAALVASRFDIRRERELTTVRGERHSLDPGRPLLGRPTACVGREAELALMETLFVECGAGAGPKVLLVTAEAGAGKSRVRHELVRRLMTRPSAPRVLHANGDPLRLSSPHVLVAQLLRQAAGIREGEPTERARAKLEQHVTSMLDGEAVQVTDFLGELLGTPFDDRDDLPLRAARSDAQAMADHLRTAFEDIVRAWSLRETLLLVLEDLHWGDVASIKLLDTVLRRLSGAPIFVLALGRPEVHQRVPGLFRNRDLTEIRLPPLPRRAAARLIEEALGSSISVSEAEGMVQRAEGNAFFLEELVRAWVEREHSASPRVGPEGLPDSVVAVAQARLERLEPKTRRMLRAASVFGDTFWLEGVATLLGESAETVASLLTHTMDHEVVARSDRPRFAGTQEFVFRHTLLRGAAYAALTEDDRKLGHGLAARWLHDIGEDGEVVALHWAEGGEVDRAAVSFTSAGEAHWTRAHADDVARCALRALLIATPSADNAEAVAARVNLLSRALKATRRLEDRDILAGLPDRVVPRAGGPLIVSALDRAHAPFRTQPPSSSFVPILSESALATAALSLFDDAQRLLDEAAEVAGGDEQLLRHVRWASARVAFLQGRLGTTWETLSQTVLPEDPRLRLEMLLMLAIAVVSVHGREALDRGLDFVSRAEALLATTAGGDAEAALLDPVARVQCAKARSACLYFTGEYLLAAESAEHTARLARDAGLRFDESSQLHNLGEKRLRLGDREGARSALERSDAIAQEIGLTSTAYHNTILLAYLDGRGELLTRLAETARDEDRGWPELHARFWLGRLQVDRGLAAARPTLERALHLARALFVRGMGDECARALAALDEGSAAP